MTTIRAIETSYKGYRFRSRLEARWAVFFDAIGFQWEYEKEGFDLGGAGWYLPDFYLRMPEWPGMPFWIEVKPGHPTDDEMRKVKDLAAQSKQPGVFLCGVPGEEEIIHIDRRGTRQPPITPLVFWKVTLRQIKDEAKVGETKMRLAYEAARSARFEHGVTPQPVREVVRMFTTPTPMMKGMRLLVRPYGKSDPDLLYPHPFPVSHLSDNGDAMCRNGGLNRAAWHEVIADVLMGNICKVCLRCAASRAARR